MNNEPNPDGGLSHEDELEEAGMLIEDLTGHPVAPQNAEQGIAAMKWRLEYLKRQRDGGVLGKELTPAQQSIRDQLTEEITLTAQRIADYERLNQSKN